MPLRLYRAFPRADRLSAARRGSRAAHAIANHVAAEVLEDRVLLAGVADDGFEDNDLRSRATDFGTTAPAAFAGLHMRDGSDWYTFSMQGTGTASDYAAIGFEHAFGNLNLEIYDSRGAILAASTTATNRELLSLNGFAAGTYYVQVVGVGGAQNSYAMAIDPAAPPAEDGFENNDTFAAATNFGTLAGGLAFAGLRMADAADFYRFRFDGPSSPYSFARVRFWHVQGDLDLDLFDAAGTLVRRSVGQGDGEEIALAGLAPGEYVLKVSGYQGAPNPYYDLLLSPYHPAEPTSGNRVLYVHFDGISVSSQKLRSWAGSDWAGSADNFDPEGNGFVVQAYERDRTDRIQIINFIVADLREDLAPFGIAVRRVTSDEVLAGATEGQGATTLFFGQTDAMPFGASGVASDVDYANNNRTDIAFVDDTIDELVAAGASVADAILYDADTAIHEAGHTYGLFHVNVRQSGTLYPETMGLAYTATTLNDLLVDTAFLDVAFREYQDHGSRNAGRQNAYQRMLEHFGRSANATKRLDFFFGTPQQQYLKDGGGCCCPGCMRGSALIAALADLTPAATGGATNLSTASSDAASPTAPAGAMSPRVTATFASSLPGNGGDSISGREELRDAATSPVGPSVAASPVTLDAVFTGLSETGVLHAA